MRSSQRTSNTNIVGNRQVRWINFTFSTYLGIPGRKCWSPRTSKKGQSFATCFSQWIGLGAVRMMNMGPPICWNHPQASIDFGRLTDALEATKKLRRLGTEKEVSLFLKDYSPIIFLFTDLWKCVVHVYIYKSHTTDKPMMWKIGVLFLLFWVFFGA